MLSKEIIKPFILHQDPMIRNFVTQYFHDCYSEDPELMPLVLKSWEEFDSKGDNHTLLNYSTRFVQNEETIKAVLKQIAIKSVHQYAFQQIFTHYDSKILRQYDDNIEKLYGPFKKSALQRLELTGLSSDQLLEELYAIVAEGEGNFMNEFDYSYGRYIVWELATREDWTVDTVLAPLYQTFDGPFHSSTDDSYDGYDVEYDYLHIYLMMLAGEKKIEKAIPSLVNVLKCKGDLSRECAVDALIQIGSDEAVYATAKTFSEECWSYRLFSSNIFEKVKSTASETCILKILPTEDDIEIRTSLASGLCKLLSVKGVSPVQQMINDGYAGSLLDLEEDFYILHVMNGLELTPGLLEWKEEKKMKHLSRSGPFARKQPVKTDKIGRNEPCPCGSGKKYKKCCGR